MTKAALTKLCRVWQARLLLQDWTITVRTKKVEEWPGRVWWDPTDTSATITIRNDTDAIMESSLVHELPHLRMCESALNDDLEVAINLLTRSFIQAYAVRSS